MPPTISKSLALATRARRLLDDVEDMDGELTAAVLVLANEIRVATSKASPAGRRWTRAEARAILAGCLEVVRHALRVDASRYRAMVDDLVDLASDAASEWAD